MNGAQITIRSDSAEKLDLKTTTYIFFSWNILDGGSFHHADGTWCKIVNAAEVEQAPLTFGGITTVFKRTIFVTPNLNFPTGTSKLEALIIPGVLYHKRVENVPIK
jgi:hypothetical protein